jgi:glycosyltransferase involved in cell wall biosynthesis
MRVLIINNDLMVENNDGLYIEKITGRFLEELLQSNITVEFFQFRDRIKNNDCRGTYNIVNRGIKIVSVQFSKNKIFAYFKAYCIGIVRVIRNDYIYLFYPNNFLLLAFFALLTGKKYGLYLRGEQGNQSKLSKFLYKHATNIFTVSPVFTDMVNAKGGNAITIAPMISVGLNEIVKSREYINKDSYQLLYLGRVEADKGVFELIEAVNLLVKTQSIPVKLNIVGDGPDAVTVTNLVNEYGLQEFVEFHGTVSNKAAIKNFYLTSDLFILPSYHEGFPRVLYEAMLLGTPVLTTFVGTIPYLMKDGFNCFKLNVRNVNSIAEQIQNIFSNYSEKAKVAINATETVSMYLSKHSKSHSDLLAEALNVA